MSEDRVLDEGKGAGGYSHNVVDLAGVRIARGWRRAGSKACPHKRLIVCSQERIIECEDCNRQVDAFDAFMILTQNFEKMTLEAKSRLHRAKEAEAAHFTRRVAKDLNRVWASGMAPPCPHCKQTLLPEDMAYTGAVNADWVRRQRNPKDPRP